MGIVLAASRDDWAAQAPGVLQRFQGVVIAVPNRQPARGDGVGFFHLRPQKGGDEFAGQIRRTDVHPGVFVHLAAEELAAVGALLADDLGASCQRRIVDQQRAAFAGDDVLGLVEAETAQQPVGKSLWRGIERLPELKFWVVLRIE